MRYMAPGDYQKLKTHEDAVVFFVSPDHSLVRLNLRDRVGDIVALERIRPHEPARKAEV